METRISLNFNWAIVISLIFIALKLTGVINWSWLWMLVLWTVILGIVFIALKLTRIINWSWLLVLIPILISICVSIGILIS